MSWCGSISVTASQTTTRGETSTTTSRASNRPLAFVPRPMYQSIDDPNDVTVWHDFDDAAVARAFVGSLKLRDAMSSAGVQGEPQLWFTQER